MNMAAATAVLSAAERLHDSMLADFAGNPLLEKPSGVTIFSLHNGKDGQWIIFEKGFDKALIASRLRLCADIIEAMKEAENAV